MPIYAREPESNYIPAPQGLHQFVCVDIWEPWTEEKKEEWGGGLVDKTRIVLLLNEQMEDGRNFEVSNQYTLSLHEKSNLCKLLTSWRGREFTSDEKKRFDLEKLIGVNGQVMVVHNTTSEGKVYANIQTIVPLAKNTPIMTIPKDYIRKKDRPKDKDAPPPMAKAAPEPFQTTEDDVPFSLALIPLVGLILSRLA